MPETTQPEPSVAMLVAEITTLSKAIDDITERVRDLEQSREHDTEIAAGDDW